MDNSFYYRGKALVIGNDHYDQMKPDLNNAVNDAKSIHEALQGLGFMMMPLAIDITTDDFDSLFNDFLSDLAKCDVAVLYYAGHGIEVEGKNYLVMKEAPVGELAITTTRRSVDLQECLSQMHKTGCKMVIMIIDACRNNPFEGNERGWGSVNLAPIFAPKGTLIAYSTSPGETASDFGMDGHSVYTGALLKHLQEEGLEVETFFKKVRSTVNAMTKGKKTSWEHTSLIGTFCFNSGKMIQVDELGYQISSVRDSDFDVNNPNVGRIISELKSYDWYQQNPAVDTFQKLKPQSLSADELFVVGRNLQQAACGGSYSAVDFIKDASLLARYTVKGENHLLNGILFEIYFNSKGLFRFRDYKSGMLDDLMGLCTHESLKCAFRFIEKALKSFEANLIFVPSEAPKQVDINIRIEKGKIKMWKDVEEEGDIIQSVQFEGYELLANKEDNDIFPFRSEWSVNKAELSSIICEGYAIPSSYLHLVMNKEIGNEQIYFNRKFRR